MSGTPPKRSRTRRRLRRRGAMLVLALASLTVGGMMLTVGVQAALHSLGYLVPRDPSELSPLLMRLEKRAGEAERRAEGLEDFHAAHLAPLVASLVTPMAIDTTQLTRIAIALVREGLANALDPRLLAAVLLVENPWLDPQAVSPVGALGLMQVMPFHAGGWGCPGDDLRDPDQNICHGARILAAYLRRTRGDLHAALLRYNGCVLGTNTPDCHQYPSWVFRRASADWVAENAWIVSGSRPVVAKASSM